MSVSSLNTLFGKTIGYNEEMEEVGHFTALNLNYDSSTYNAKRNAEQLIKELNADLQSSEDTAENDHNDDIYSKSDQDYKRRLLIRIQQAAKILSNEESRNEYLHEIKTRCYLSQIFTFVELRDKFSGRLFPFFIFEVYKKNGRLLQDRQHRFLCLNLIEMIIEEEKDGQPLRGFNCSSIKQIMPGFNNDEVYLSVEDGEETHTHHYQLKYAQQRELLIELVLFSKYASEKRCALKSERMQNPNIDPNQFEKSSDNILLNLIGQNSSSNSTSRTFRMLPSDRVMPPKPLFQAEVYKKHKTLFGKKIWLTVGTSNIIISQDKIMKKIHHVFPINKDAVSFIKVSDKGDFAIISNDTRNYFHANKSTDAEITLNLISDVIKGNFEHEQVVTSLPYSKKDANVTKILLTKYNEINQKISETKDLLATLRSKKAEIKNLLMKEKQKARCDNLYTMYTMYSTDTKSLAFSKTSFSNEENIPRSQLSLFTLDEKMESVAPQSRDSLSLSPFSRKEKSLEAHEAFEPRFSFKKDTSETRRDQNQDGIHQNRDKVSIKRLKLMEKGTDPNHKKSEKKFPSLRVNTDTDKRRGYRRFMSVKLRDDIEKTSLNALPMSMKELTKTTDDIILNYNPDFGLQNSSPQFEVQTKVAYAQDEDKDESGVLESKRQKFGPK